MARTDNSNASASRRGMSDVADGSYLLHKYVAPIDRANHPPFGTSRLNAPNEGLRGSQQYDRPNAAFSSELDRLVVQIGRAHV